MAKPEVAIDARRLQDRPMTGVGRGLSCVLPHLQDEFDLLLLTDAGRPPLAPEWRQVALFGWWGLPEPLWLHLSAGKKMRSFDGVFHGTYNGLPLHCPVPSVVTIHDLSFDLHPEDLTTSRRLVIGATARRSMRAARVILTPSRYIRQGIIETYGIRPDRVRVAPQAPDPIFGPDQARDRPTVLDRQGVGPRYVVAIGGARRRALPTAVEAWLRLGADRPDLVVVGSETPPPRPGVFHVGRVDDREWAGVLAGAEALLYPTRYEGYGMPAIEAAASGVPVVCARIGALEEVLGEAAEWSPSTEAPDMAVALARVLGDDRRRKELREAGLARAASSPGWADIAAVIGQAYRDAGSEGRS